MRYMIARKNSKGFEFYLSSGGGDAAQWLTYKEQAYSFPTDGMAQEHADDLNKKDKKLKAYVVPAYEVEEEE